jgi:KEOPS complex subunit Cgi121
MKYMIHILEGTVFVDNVDAFLHRLRKISEEKKMVFLALDADKLAGEEHIRFAVEKAVSSFERGKNIAKDLAKEIMLYAAGTRQITKAMKLGIHEGQNNVVLVAINNRPDFSAFTEITPQRVLEYRPSKKEILMELFSITKEEIEAVGEQKIPELVLERVALLDISK